MQFYISSLVSDAHKIGSAIPQHWGIENSVHWTLDQVFMKMNLAFVLYTAHKILLYLHGIIGDTKSLLPSVLANTRENGQEKTLQDKYDLVLALDYENIKTTIQQNAKLLKQRLEEVGLTAKEGKKLDVVAHSMGGLVSRTFIEEENGKQIVRHLVMLGTPNAGSPWPQIKDWALTALSIGLNGLFSVTWSVSIIAG